MFRKTLVAGVVLFGWASTVSAQGAASAPAPVMPRHQVEHAHAGFSTERLERIDEVMQQYVDENRIAGVVGVVLQDGQTVYERAFGWADKEAGREMTVDEEAYNVAMAKQREDSRASSKFAAGDASGEIWFAVRDASGATSFQGYELEETSGRLVNALVSAPT